MKDDVFYIFLSSKHDVFTKVRECIHKAFEEILIGEFKIECKFKNRNRQINFQVIVKNCARKLQKITLYSVLEYNILKN